MRRTGTIAVALLGVGFAGPNASAIDVPDYDFEWCVIGDPGNEPYPGPIDYSYFPIIGRGRVQYVYRMAMTEVTSAQWVEFYNALAAVAPEIAVEEAPYRSGAVFVGTIMNPRWEVGPGEGDAMRPTEISIRAAARFCNWLHNGKSPELAAFMDGAYDASTFGWSDELDDFTDDYTRSEGALFFMPNLDEWMKAVYHDPEKATRDGWWHFPLGSDEWPVTGLPGEAGAQTVIGADLPVFTHLNVPLMSYSDAHTPWGLRDASGGMSEWSELKAPSRSIWGTGMYSFGSMADARIDQPDTPYARHPDELLFLAGEIPSWVPWGINLRVASASSCAVDQSTPWGLLDLGDVVAFIQHFIAGDPAADLTGDGAVDHMDIEFFAAAFVAWCL